MRVKYIRKNANDLSLNRHSHRLYASSYDSRGPDEDKDYGGKNPFLKLGYEANVYAMKIRGECTSFYIMEPKFNTMTHFPSLCFEILDNRVSKYWHIDRDFVPRGEGNFPREPFEITVFAIREWIEEPRFLEFLVDDRERELGIMNKMIELMDEEFLPVT